MTCEFCGALMDHSTLICTTCGSQRSEQQQPRVEQRIVPTEPAEVDTRATCEAHPGRPLLGTCPRCGKQVCVVCAPQAITDVLTCTDCEGLTASHQPAPAGATCAVHPEARAAFICARCGAFACALCRSTAAVQGNCVRCNAGTGPLATRSARFGANLIDNFVVVMPALAVFMVAAVLRRTTKELGPYLLLGASVSLMVAIVAQVWAQISWGQSIGKRLLGIKVVRLSGQPIELWRLLLLRNLLVHAVSQACSLFGLIDALFIFGAEQRCVHDYLADSMVVEVSQTRR